MASNTQIYQNKNFEGTSVWEIEVMMTRKGVSIPFLKKNQVGTSNLACGQSANETG